VPYLIPQLGTIRLDKLRRHHVVSLFDIIDERNDTIRTARASTDPDVRRTVRGVRPTGPATQQRIRATLRVALTSTVLGRNRFRTFVTVCSIAVRSAAPLTSGGSVLRVIEFGPGFVSPTHRTESIDYIAMQPGELELELDGGSVIRLRPGAIVVQRGTNHLWRNPSQDTPCPSPGSSSS
jgi:hypothetical protein